jgi:hypothetical protein
MSEQSDAVHSPVEMTVELLTNSWRSVLTIYYANTVSWRVLKSGALVFLGFALWAGGNVLKSVQPGLGALNYVMAYGFVLIVYGPFHHVVVIPYALKWRRRGEGRLMRVGRRLPNGSLVFFLGVVLVIGTFPAAAGPMAVDFDATLESSGADINPDLLCTKATNGTDTEVHCHLTKSEGIDTVTVESGGERIASDRTPPFDFTVSTGEMNEVVGDTQFQVVLREENGDVIRRYTRTVSMIEEAD